MIVVNDPSHVLFLLATQKWCCQVSELSRYQRRKKPQRFRMNQNQGERYQRYCQYQLYHLLNQYLPGKESRLPFLLLLSARRTIYISCYGATGKPRKHAIGQRDSCPSSQS